MPELPELEVLREYLGPRLENRTITAVWTSPKLSFLLRTPPDEFARQLTGGSFQRVWRRGKFLIFDIGNQHLVINPMLGGRLQWTTAVDKVMAATVFRITLDSGDELRFLDTVKMGRVYWVADGGLPTIPGWAELGPDALTASPGDFAQRIRRHPGELKNLLRNQAFVAGVGNAYSDEILHHAELLPLRKRSTLKADDVIKLHQSTHTVLQSAIDAIKAQPHYEPHKQDRSFMAVHGKGGQKCPRCGHKISQLTARGENTNFCRGCQH
jgi:formamidopyrimidine-DNA glycosylase